MSRTNTGACIFQLLVGAAEVVAGVAADHELAVAAAADDVQPLAQREHDRVVPVDPLLEQRDPLVEPVRVLVARLDVLDLAPGELLVEQRLERLRLERLARERRRLHAGDLRARPGTRPPTRPGVTLPGLGRALRRHGRRRDSEREVLGQVPEAAELRRPPRRELDRLLVADLDRVDQLAGQHPLALGRPPLRAPAAPARGAAAASRVAVGDAVDRLGEARRGGGPRRRRARPPPRGRSSGSPSPAAPFITEW